MGRGDDPSGERRGGERRQQILRALLQGHLWQRRRNPRRGGANQLGSIDWHEPQWLAAALLMFLAGRLYRREALLG